MVALASKGNSLDEMAEREMVGTMEKLLTGMVVGTVSVEIVLVEIVEIVETLVIVEILVIVAAVAIGVVAAVVAVVVQLQLEGE